MKKKQKDAAAYELHDRPVPPVKGAITEGSNLQSGPETVQFAETVRFGNHGTPESRL